MTTMEMEGMSYEPSFGTGWWIFLITGTLWFSLGLVVFRFDLSSAKAIGILAGVVFLCAGVLEFAMVAVVHGGFWKALNVILGLLLIVGGIFAFIRPSNAFIALASITAFMLLFVGLWDIIVAFSIRNDDSIWWVRLTAGIIAVLLAFWAAGDFDRKAIILVAWVGAFCLLRGINSFFVAFALRRAGKEQHV
jgi:uncharacterized membrane protein HdeD (DUF308 family)